MIAANGLKQVPDGIVMANGEAREVAGIRVEATPAYDVTPGVSFHPKGEANGYIVTIGGQRIYIVGVTECVPEIRAGERHRRRVLPDESARGPHGAGGGDRLHQGVQAESCLSVPLRSGLGDATSTAANHAERRRRADCRR